MMIIVFNHYFFLKVFIENRYEIPIFVINDPSSFDIKVDPITKMKFEPNQVKL